MADTVEVREAPKQILNPESWFIKEPPILTLQAREIFETYSKIPHDEVASHIKEIRDKAFKIFPYPCLGRWSFLDFSLRKSTQFSNVLERIKNGEQYLDIGCCVGQDIRTLVAHGAPSENMYGSDLKGTFIDIGYDLFLDRATLKTKFIEADVFDPESKLKPLYGTIDIVHAAAFFHLFDWGNQVIAAKRVVQLLKAQPGSMIVGRQIGHVEADPMVHRFDSGVTLFKHNVESFAKLWKQVGDETNTRWEVEASLNDEELANKFEAKNQDIPTATRWLMYSVRMI